MRLLSSLATVLALALCASTARAADDHKPESLWDLIQGKYDANKDGVVLKTEYTRSDKAFGTSDRNQDGVLTSADYRPQRPRMAPPGADGPRGMRRPPGRMGPPQGRRGPRPDGPRGPGQPIGADRDGPPAPMGPRAGPHKAPTCPHCGKDLPRPPFAREGQGPRGGPEGRGMRSRRDPRGPRFAPPGPRRPVGPNTPPIERRPDDAPPPPPPPPAPKAPDDVVKDSE